MSSKNRPPRHPGSLGAKIPFSEKEQAIMQEEITDKDSIQRNVPTLLDLLKKHPRLQSLRINPFQIMAVVESRHRSVMASMSVGGEGIQDAQFMDMIVQDFCEQVNPELILEYLIPAAKEAKIKRERRVLLWAVAEIFGTIGAKRSLKESAAIRVIVLNSVQASMKLSNMASLFIREAEPFTFSYKRILEDSFTNEDWMAVLDQVESIEPDFTYTMSQQALYFFEKLSRPFGLRFHNIIRYPRAMKEKPKRSILMPGESEVQQNDELDENTSRRLAEAMMKDISPARRIEFAKNALTSIKSAAFGEIDEKTLNMSLNAAAYCFLTFMPICPFLIQLYNVSGEKADQINPADEKELIIDLKGSPDNPRLYQKYAELLEQKGEKRGAAQVYDCWQELQEKRDPDVDAKILQLLKDAQEADVKAPQTVEEMAAAAESAPKSNLIITP